MPLGKYYCDYCDKQFQDTPFHRKRHIQGLHHQRTKALWYASIPPDPNQTSVHPSIGVCNRFIRTGSCPYGDSCKYFHPNQNMQNRNMQSLTVANNLETQLPSFLTSLPVERSSLPGGGMLGNLPPSLRPPPEGLKAQHHHLIDLEGQLQVVTIENPLQRNKITLQHRDPNKITVCDCCSVSLWRTCFLLKSSLPCVNGRSWAFEAFKACSGCCRI